MRSLRLSRNLPSLFTVIAATTSACAHSPTGQPQLLLVSDSEMREMGAAAFQEAKAETPPTKDPGANEYVRCISAGLARVVAPNERWEVAVFDSPQVNAFALPGGKIGVYTGILHVAETPDQLAAVLGHEMAHVFAKHSNARVSAAMAADTGLTLTSLIAGGPRGRNRDLLALLGVGAQVGVLLPYSRDQETEADVLGIDYMARAGFDPAASIDLWRNMARAGGSRPPTFLSTHPSPEGRMKKLAEKLPAANARFQEARLAGNTPRCTRPGIEERPAQAPTSPPEPGAAVDVSER
jgi:predicted Zn-dependent protease